MKKYKVGYTAGVYDMFHVGHLNILKNAKEYCDVLIVGVNSDDLTYSYKNKYPVINENDRKQIVESIKYVDKAFIITNRDKVDAWKKYNFDVIFIGSDWKGTEQYTQYEKDLKEVGVDLIYLPHTDGISSTMLREKLNNEK